MQDIYKMAGRVAAHAVLSVSEGELLVPIYGYLSNEGTTHMVRVASASGEEAMREGQKMLDENPWQAAGGVWAVDGFITLPEVGKVDALLLTITSYEQPRRGLKMAIPYRHAQTSEGFAVFKPKLVQLTGLEKDQLQPLMSAFYTGRDEHAEAAPVWKRSLQEQITSQSGFSGFAAYEWEHLRLAPLVVWGMVATADGEIDKKEVQALTKLFEASGKYPSVLMQRVMSELSPHTPQGRAILQEFLGSFGDLQTSQYFAALNTLFSEKPEHAALVEPFIKDLLDFGTAVASSSGGFLGFGSKISKEEKNVLEVISRLLTSPPELSQFIANLVNPSA